MQTRTEHMQNICWVFTHDIIYAIARICYRPSVRHTGESYKDGREWWVKSAVFYL